MNALLLAAAPAHLTLPKINYLAILPELILLGGAIIVLLAASLVRGGLKRTVATGLTPAALAAPARRHAGDQVVQQGPQRIQVGGAGGWGALQ